MKPFIFASVRNSIYIVKSEMFLFSLCEVYLLVIFLFCARFFRFYEYNDRHTRLLFHFLYSTDVIHREYERNIVKKKEVYQLQKRIIQLRFRLICLFILGTALPTRHKPL